MTVEELKAELEKVISDLTATEFENIDPGIIEKIKALSETASELGMKEGKRLIENLSGAINAIKEGRSKAESGNIRLTALEFYLKNQSGSENIEDL
jgi:ribosomal protein L7/L12